MGWDVWKVVFLAWSQSQENGAKHWWFWSLESYFPQTYRDDIWNAYPVMNWGSDSELCLCPHSLWTIGGDKELPKIRLSHPQNNLIVYLNLTHIYHTHMLHGAGIYLPTFTQKSFNVDKFTIFTQKSLNVDNYSIHGASGIYVICFFTCGLYVDVDSTCERSFSPVKNHMFFCCLPNRHFLPLDTPLWP